MKNLKIGKKLFIGFAVPITLMIVIAILVVVMNLLVVNSITTIGKQTDLWHYAALAQSDFLAASDSANNLTYEYSDELFNETLALLAPAQEAADTASKMAGENPTLEQFYTIANTAAENLTDYTTALNEMAGYLDQANDASAATVSAGTNLQQHMSDVMAGQINSMKTEYTEGGGTDAGNTRAERFLSVDELIAELASVRINTRGQLSLYDTAGANETLALMDDFTVNLTAFRDVNTIEANKQKAQTLIDDIANYKANFQSYVDFEEKAIKASEAFKANATAASDALTTLAAQNDAVNQNVESASNMAYLSLFLIVCIVIGALVITSFIALYITRSITRPINYVTEILSAVGKRGRTNFSDEEWAEQRGYASGKDEMAECSDNLGRVANSLNSIAEMLTEIADGDLTINHTAMSEDDVISTAVIRMLDNLNNMFGEIRTASRQVSMGASQISDASQNLAQGSTEQAATVEELSASIEEVAVKTKQNSERAADAARLSDTIKSNAQKGSQQMAEMTQAVDEINIASQDISKVIKVIDDIAFQTNILALNAAVEAARAGEAGKGFAVVADEVRNLASKSAAAAKETGILIENSMRKAELGSTIASQTADSLTEIVSGINQSTELINQIAESSEEQTISINQINEGITQVSEVVQKNSATAEECAASAEELNAQSTILAENVARFKLR